MSSVLDLFTIGIGPSSSHTVGPMRAARRFVQGLANSQDLSETDAITVDLFGSLAQHAQCHGTVRAILLGFLGEAPEHVDPGTIEEKLADTFERKCIMLLGHHPIAFDTEYDVSLYANQHRFPHPNAMRFSACDWGKRTLASKLFYSVGDGSVIAEDERLGRKATTVIDDPPYPYRSAVELLRLGREHKKAVWEIALENEKTISSEDEIEERVFWIWQTMQNSIYQGLQTSGVLPGGLGNQRRAPKLYEDLLAGTDDDPFRMTDWVTLFAMAVTEENAAGSRVVAAPTNGSAGVIPAVAHYYMEFVEEANINGLYRLLLTAAAIGALYKHNAPISSAETGCQGEVGVACSMAAGGLVAALEGTNEQVERAAAAAMECYLGMPCDAVSSLVQTPCIERNGLAAITAVNIAQTAMTQTTPFKLTLDQTIDKMREKPTPDQIKTLAGANIEKSLFDKAAEETKKIYQSLGGDGRVAKGSELGDKLLAQLEKGLGKALADGK